MSNHPTASASIRVRTRRVAIAAGLSFLLGCAGLTAQQVIADADKVLNSACNALTWLPSQVAVCAGVQGAELLANLIESFVEQHSTSAATATAVRKLKESPAKPTEKINGLPAFAPPELAAALNESKENAALLAFVQAGLAQTIADAGAAK